MLWHTKFDQELLSGFVANHWIPVGLAVDTQLKATIHSLPESIKFSSNSRALWGVFSSSMTEGWQGQPGTTVVDTSS